MRKIIYGYEKGCSFCGKPMTKKGWFNPFYTPTLKACNRNGCRFKRKLIPKIKNILKGPISFIYSLTKKWLEEIG